MSNKLLTNFDYTIKYILKNKSNYDLIKSFISALIKEKSYVSVKINALLLNYKNNEKTVNIRKFIIKSGRFFTNNFIHKAFFYNDEYFTTIKKVFHTTLFCFIQPNMNKLLYPDKTIFKTIDPTGHVDPHIVNLSDQIFDLTILLEYFLILIPLFDNVIKQKIVIGYKHDYLANQ